ncbi:hypothetical protein [Vibrio cholerae]|uniref:hypothetical protein n=1 Tax=Vibrio cholerae TaxID=666 RepID=UPI000E0C0A01|nr:hypothetical protein [Vibrio cholerae]
MKIENLEGYDDYYDVDGTPLEFCSKRKTVHYKGIKVVLDRLPYLINSINGCIYFTTPAVAIINDYVDEAIRKEKKEVRINEFGRFDRGKLPVAGNTVFKYSPAEHFFIPGLIRDIPSDGFLTPVYFDKHVLVKFEHADDYGITRHTESAGRIHGADGIDAPYGVNKNGYVIMWLGDIVKFPNKELLYLYSANVEPQYDIHSDFYKNQILGEWLQTNA